VKILFVNLYALLLLGTFGSGISAAETGRIPAVGDTMASSTAASHKVVVYYLYFTPRCETCLNMEAFAKEAVETGFANELKQGTVEWHSYDTGNKEYEHFWNEFKLETKSLIMVDVQNGKQVQWKNCEKIWDLVGAKPDFMKYVQDEVRAYRTNP
jgi:hypothetical protein